MSRADIMGKALENRKRGFKIPKKKTIESKNPIGSAVKSNEEPLKKGKKKHGAIYFERSKN